MSESRCVWLPTAGHLLMISKVLTSIDGIVKCLQDRYLGQDIFDLIISYTDAHSSLFAWLLVSRRCYNEALPRLYLNPVTLDTSKQLISFYTAFKQLPSIRSHDAAGERIQLITKSTVCYRVSRVWLGVTRLQNGGLAFDAGSPSTRVAAFEVESITRPVMVHRINELSMWVLGSITRDETRALPPDGRCLFVATCDPSVDGSGHIKWLAMSFEDTSRSSADCTIKVYTCPGERICT